MKSVLRCLYCASRFSEDDVACLNYFVQVQACHACLLKMQSQPYRRTCFGKLNKLTAEGKIEWYGFDPLNEVMCRDLCTMRYACQLFASGDVAMYRERLHLEARSPFKKGSLIADAFKMCLRGTTKKKLQVFIESQDGDFVHIMRMLRAGVSNSKLDEGKTRWRLDEDKSVLKVYYVMQVHKGE